MDQSWDFLAPIDRLNVFNKYIKIMFWSIKINLIHIIDNFNKNFEYWVI